VGGEVASGGELAPAAWDVGGKVVFDRGLARGTGRERWVAAIIIR